MKHSKKYQPKGLEILHEDRDIIVVDKVSGLLTIANDRERERTAYYLLNDYVRKGNSRSSNRIFIVHRLDRETSGVIVFAKSEEAKRYLQDNWQDFRKTYTALARGELPEKEGVITSYLVENSIHKMYSVSNPEKGKFAKTGYRVVDTTKNYSLLEIDLMTGRKNQIRVHLADKGCPVVGDKRYGTKQSGIKRLCLHSYSLSIKHPHSKEEVTFTSKNPSYFRFLMRADGSTSKPPPSQQGRKQ
jgi:RluA family pseudouridine synthase